MLSFWTIHLAPLVNFFISHPAEREIKRSLLITDVKSDDIGNYLILFKILVLIFHMKVKTTFYKGSNQLYFAFLTFALFQLLKKFVGFNNLIAGILTIANILALIKLITDKFNFEVTICITGIYNVRKAAHTVMQAYNHFAMSTIFGYPLCGVSLKVVQYAPNDHDDEKRHEPVTYTEEANFTPEFLQPYDGSKSYDLIWIMAQVKPFWDSGILNGYIARCKWLVLGVGFNTDYDVFVDDEKPQEEKKDGKPLRKEDRKKKQDKRKTFEFISKWRDLLPRGANLILMNNYASYDNPKGKPGGHVSTDDKLCRIFPQVFGSSGETSDPIRKARECIIFCRSN